MRKIFIAITMASFLLTLSACSQVLVPDWGTNQMIEEMSKRFAQVANKRNAPALANFYTESAKLLPPNSEIVVGREAVQKYWQGFFDATISLEITLQPIEIDFKEGLAYEVGIYSLKYQPKSENSKNQAQAIIINLIETGKYITVWKHQMDGSWQIVADTWNTNTPPR
jgi:ketosteroid isomerase-like protein